MRSTIPLVRGVLTLVRRIRTSTTRSVPILARILDP